MFINIAKKDPCDKCLVRVTCTEECLNSKKYYEHLLSILRSLNPHYTKENEYPLYNNLLLKHLKFNQLIYNRRLKRLNIVVRDYKLEEAIDNEIIRFKKWK